MNITPVSALYYQAQEFAFEQTVSPTLAKIIALNPEFILGSYHLFEYDPLRQAVVLSPAFKSLLQLSVNLEVLDPAILEATSFEALNTIFQKPQGPKAGFLRKAGDERWHLEDSPGMKEKRPYFDELLKQLGFLSETTFATPVKVDHCVIFGASVPRKETRILSTWKYLQESVNVTGHVFLLGSNRKITDDEKKLLQIKINTLPPEEQLYWNETFKDPELATEANACTFLWKNLISQEWQEKLQVISLNSTRIGYSYGETGGHRATTETTVEDWMEFYEADKPQSIFAFIEQPFGRLADQLRDTVLSSRKKASLQELEQRLKNTTFYFAQANPTMPPLLSVVMDEIARNVYRIKGCIEYCDKLSTDESPSCGSLNTPL